MTSGRGDTAGILEMGRWGGVGVGNRWLQKEGRY